MDGLGVRVEWTSWAARRGPTFQEGPRSRDQPTMRLVMDGISARRTSLERRHRQAYHEAGSARLLSGFGIVPADPRLARKINIKVICR